MRKSLLFLLFIFIFTFSYSQKDTSSFHYGDTTKTGNKIKNPNLAIALSSVVPGSGQIYNGKFWKIPIIYGGLYASYYFARKSNFAYQAYKSDILILTDTIPSGVPVTGIYDLDELANKYNVSRRKRDLAILGGILVWGLNVLDAYIDAELSNFDVSDDLSMKIYPSVNYFNPNNPSVALTVQFYFK